jgi:hypothetical protein
MSSFIDAVEQRQLALTQEADFDGNTHDAWRQALTEVLAEAGPVAWQCRCLDPAEGPSSWQHLRDEDVELFDGRTDYELRRLVTAPPADPQAQLDAVRLDYLQKQGATVDLVGQDLLFRIGGMHSTMRPNIRDAIDAAISKAGEA